MCPFSKYMRNEKERVASLKAYELVRLLDFMVIGGLEEAESLAPCSPSSD